MRKQILLGSIAVLLMGSVLHAGTITQSGTFGPAATDVGNGGAQPATDFTFAQFGSGYTCPVLDTCTGSWVLGAILESVTINVTGSVNVTNLTFTADQGVGGGFSYDSTVSVQIGGTAANADLTSLNNYFPGGNAAAIAGTEGNVLFGIGDSTPQQILLGEKLTFAPGTPTASMGSTLIYTGTGVYTFNSGITAADPSAYAGNGSFTLNYNTFSLEPATGAQSNLTTVQNTTTTATYTVTYNYDLAPTPEPSTAGLAISSFVLLGLFGIRRRVVSRVSQNRF